MRERAGASGAAASLDQDVSPDGLLFLSPRAKAKEPVAVRCSGGLARRLLTRRSGPLSLVPDGKSVYSRKRTDVIRSDGTNSQLAVGSLNPSAGQTAARPPFPDTGFGKCRPTDRDSPVPGWRPSSRSAAAIDSRCTVFPSVALLLL
jgi:hypothetical protein